MLKVDYNIGISGAVGFVIGLFGVGYGLGQRKKMNDICYKIDKSIEEVSSNIDVNVSECIINDAVAKAAAKETKWVVKQSVDRMIEEIETDIENQVNDAVADTYKDIRKTVSDEVAKKAAHIDIQLLKNEVIEKAKTDVAKKLDNSMDDILENFNHNLKNVSHIYQSIAQTFSKDYAKGIV